MENTELLGYLLVLVLGAGLTLVVGVVLRRSGQAILEEAYPPPRAAGLTRLVTVGYHLAALGVLGLISTLDVPVDGAVQTVVTKLGVVLLILGVVYAVTLLVLGRMRDAAHRVEIDEEFHTAMRRRPAA
ncbi:MAG TPA: hypothetical protein VGH99_22710 [Pseudonocardia sp.]|jgi:hypothetical protein